MSTPENRPGYNTPNLGLPVPGDAGPADAHADIGALADRLDELYARLLSQPGDIKASAAAAPTSGWLLCDGAAVDRTVYADLFTAIGTAYGAGDGATTFNLPNLKDAFPKGAPTPATVGARGGESTHTLDVNEMPVHAHSVYDPGHAHGLADPGHLHGAGNRFDFMGGAGGSWYASRSVDWGGGVGTDTRGTGQGVYGAGTGVSLYNNGSGWAHNNLPPFQNVNWFIKI